MDKKIKGISFQFIFIMLLYVIILILSIMIIFLGKNIYQDINQDRKTNYELGVSLSFVSNKIRQSDKENFLEIKDLHGENALVINEFIDEEKYQTWIYFYQGAIYEIFTHEENIFDLSDGMKIVDIDVFDIIKVKDNLYRFKAESQGERLEIYLSPYSKGVL